MVTSLHWYHCPWSPAGLVKPSSQKILVPTPRGQGLCRGPWQGMPQPNYCKRHTWCSLPCIECAGQDMYESSYGSRPSTGSMLPGSGASFTYVDMGMTTLEGTGASYMPGFSEAPPGKHLRRLKLQASPRKREPQPTAKNPLLSAERDLRPGLWESATPQAPKRARAVFKHVKTQKDEQSMGLRRQDTTQIPAGSPRPRQPYVESAGSSRLGYGFCRLLGGVTRFWDRIEFDDRARDRDRDRYRAAKEEAIQETEPAR